MSPLACSHSGMASRKGASIRRQCRMERRGASSLGGTGRPHNTASLPDITIAMRYSIPAKGMKHQPFAAVPFLSSYFSRFLPGWLTAGPVPVLGSRKSSLVFFCFHLPKFTTKLSACLWKSPGASSGKAAGKGGNMGKRKEKSRRFRGITQKKPGQWGKCRRGRKQFFCLIPFCGL